MFITVKIADKNYQIESLKPLDISIPLKFGGGQPNAYGVEKATAIAYKAGDIVGDTRLGGSVNFEQYTLIPHCNGTHTECVGHITNERISIRDCLKDIFIPSILITVQTETAVKSRDRYSSQAIETDELITLESLKSAFPTYHNFPFSEAALIVRTLPNDDSKLYKEYGEYVPPFLSIDAIDHIVERGFKHLLVDTPSIDRIFDRGELSNHRKFWRIEAGKFEVNAGTRRYSTITELIFVPNEIEDGEYLLNLQITAFESDASPSRPVLLPIKH